MAISVCSAIILITFLELLLRLGGEGLATAGGNFVLNPQALVGRQAAETAFVAVAPNDAQIGARSGAQAKVQFELIVAAQSGADADGLHLRVTVRGAQVDLCANGVAIH